MFGERVKRAILGAAIAEPHFDSRDSEKDASIPPKAGETDNRQTQIDDHLLASLRLAKRGNRTWLTSHLQTKELHKKWSFLFSEAITVVFTFARGKTTQKRVVFLFSRLRSGQVFLDSKIKIAKMFVCLLRLRRLQL